jgi:hypothetical protein
MQKYDQPTTVKPYFLSFQRRDMSEGIVFEPPTKRWIYALPKAVQKRRQETLWRQSYVMHTDDSKQNMKSSL